MKTNLSGIVTDMAMADYHAHSAESSSGIREFMKSPAHYQAYRTEPRTETKSMKFGTSWHALVNEPGLFAKTYVKAPEGIDRRTKAGKEAWAAFELEHAGKIILKDEEYAALDGMLYSLLKNRTALALLTEGKAEQSIFWQDEKTGLHLKCRPDFLRTDGVIIDLKTTQDASKKGFQRAVANYGYHVQSQWYLTGCSTVMGEPLTEFAHICIETKAPYAVAIYTLDDAALRVAELQIRDALERLKSCREKNEWPSYGEDIQNVGLPAWME